MTTYVLTPAARSDLSDIWDYTADTWSAGQANRYVLGIRDACEALAAGSRAGRPIEAIRPGYRRLGIGMHALFYRRSSAGLIEIIRILHQRMDASQHLDDQSLIA